MNLDTQLRSLDVAASQPDAHRRAHASTLLEDVVGQPPTIPKAGRAATNWRMAGAIAAGTLIAATAVIVPGLTPSLPAVASWVPEPAAVSTSDLAIAEDACRGELGKYARQIDGDTPVVLAERRGDNIGLILWEPNPEAQGTCVVELAEGSTSVEGIVSAFGGSSGPALNAPAGEFMAGGISQFRAEDGTISLTSGSVGEGVVAIRLHADGISTEATIDDGRFVAWWPGRAFEDSQEPSGQGGPASIITYDLTLNDGTTITNADSWFPSN
ncbi:hypothetical protein [Agromyces arachidis]|uniref:hypothetical protein n=1 Tax=Agromyces arachidis TaxID=766966 RepID=UPI004056EBC2